MAEVAKVCVARETKRNLKCSKQSGNTQRCGWHEKHRRKICNCPQTNARYTTVKDDVMFYCTWREIRRFEQQTKYDKQIVAVGNRIGCVFQGGIG